MTGNNPTERGANGQKGGEPAPLSAQPAVEVHVTVASGTGDTSIAPDLPRAAREGQSPLAPTEFGRYKLLRSLGQGAMGVVYLAEDTQLQRQVALKIPQIEASAGSTRLERFYREARLAATLRHPNLCPVYDVGEFQGTHFISMAYIEGKSLDALLKSGKPQSERAAAGLVRKVALALEEAHSHGVIHRDLKPANIMIDRRGEPIVMDFGLARQMNSIDQAQITHSGAIIGTPSYMSPEQVQGKTDEVGAASDIYGLGVILYQLLTGRLPFQGSMVSILAQIVTQTPAPPSSFRDRLSPEIEAICLQAMAKRASDRFASMAEFATALTQYLRKNPGRTDQSRTGSADNEAASAGAPVAMSLAGVAKDESSSADPARLIAAPVGHRVAAKWRGFSRRARIAAACFGVAFVVLAVVIIIKNRDGTETKITVDDGDGDDTLITVTRERPGAKRDKPQEGPRGSEKLESGPAQAAKPKPEPSDEKGRSFDLLALMDGAVALADGGQMFAMTEQRDGTPIPFQLPDGVEEYDVTLVARRLGTGLGLSLNVPLPAVGRFVNFYLDGYSGSGLQFIDGKDYTHPEVNQKAALFRTGSKSTIVCKIRRDRIEAIVDGRPLINWTGDQKRLAGRAQRFVLGCHNAHFEITELTVSVPARLARLALMTPRDYYRSEGPAGQWSPVRDSRDSVIVGGAPALSADDLQIVFWRNDPNGQEPSRLLYGAQRSTVGEPFGEPVRILGPGPGDRDSAPTLAEEGLTLYFRRSPRWPPSPEIPHTLFTARRPDRNAAFSRAEAVPGFPQFCAGATVFSPDGTTSIYLDVQSELPHWAVRLDDGSWESRATNLPTMIPNVQSAITPSAISNTGNILFTHDADNAVWLCLSRTRGSADDYEPPERLLNLHAPTRPVCVVSPTRDASLLFSHDNGNELIVTRVPEGVRLKIVDALDRTPTGEPAKAQIDDDDGQTLAVDDAPATDGPAEAANLEPSDSAESALPEAELRKAKSPGQTPASRKAPRRARPAPTDVFPVNSVWKGIMHQTFDDDTPAKDWDYTITVTERSKNVFKATFVMGDQAFLVCDFEGTVSQNTIEWNTVNATVKKGTVGRHHYRGRISNGNRLDLRFSGTTPTYKGTAGMGTAILQEP